MAEAITRADDRAMQTTTSPTTTANDGGSRRAFTLMELLIVVTIVSILLSLLLPVIGLVRDTARQAGCASQLRQLGLAMIGYARDNRGRFTTVLTRPAGAMITWDDLLGGGGYDGRNLPQSVMGDDLLLYDTPGNRLYMCPSDTAADAPTVTYWRRSYTMTTGYATGGHFTSPAPRMPGQCPVCLAHNGACCKWGIADVEWSTTLNQVPAASVIMLTEVPTNHARGDYNILGNVSFMDIGDPSVQVGRTPHRGRSSYLYCDGHVVAKRPQDTVEPGGTLNQPRGGWTRNNLP